MVFKSQSTPSSHYSDLILVFLCVFNVIDVKCKSQVVHHKLLNSFKLAYFKNAWYMKTDETDENWSLMGRLFSSRSRLIKTFLFFLLKRF